MAQRLLVVGYTNHFLEKKMKSQQSGFTLVEIAIVLVIIGLLLGGILKGQELINSAKVKNLANDFRTVPTYIYAYQDKFKALPGDDPQVVAHVNGATLATTPGGLQGNGVINGAWNSTTATDESYLFWQHVRLANLAAGPTSTADPDYAPKNVDGGRTGIQGGVVITLPTAMNGTYTFCSSGILGKFAKQLDIQMDDGNTETGSMRTATAAAPNTAVATTAIIDSDSYNVCMAF
jgi:prepilin-type N-terminal cleavage/methylation domain-containing protein